MNFSYKNCLISPACHGKRSTYLQSSIKDIKKIAILIVPKQFRTVLYRQYSYILFIKHTISYKIKKRKAFFNRLTCPRNNVIYI